MPHVAKYFIQKCQQEVSQAQELLNNLPQKLNLSETEAEQIVWSEALYFARA